MRHTCDIDIYLDYLDEDLTFCFEMPAVDGSYIVSYEFDQTLDMGGYPEAKLMIFDSPAMATQAKAIIELTDPDAVVKLGTAHTGEGLLIMSADTYRTEKKVADAISVFDMRTTHHGYPIDLSWEQHDFALEARRYDVVSYTPPAPMQMGY